MNLDELDIPAWVEKAWSEPISKSDILFRSVSAGEGEKDGWETNASVIHATEYAYAEGYRLAGRILADYVIQERWDTDFLVYPIVFLYRHNIELQLKRLTPQAGFLTGAALTDAERKLLMSSHRLDQLWGLFEPLLRRLATVSVAEIEGMAAYVGQIHENDEQSFSFRYMTTKDGAPSIDKKKLPHINIGVLAAGMEKLTATLYGLGEAFHEELQARCEVEAAAWAEYAECFRGE